jgi:hypothetical protein
MQQSSISYRTFNRARWASNLQREKYPMQSFNLAVLAKAADVSLKTWCQRLPLSHDGWGDVPLRGRAIIQQNSQGDSIMGHWHAPVNFAGIGITLPAPYVLIDQDAREDAHIYDKEAQKIGSPQSLNSRPLICWTLPIWQKSGKYTLTYIHLLWYSVVAVKKNMALLFSQDQLRHVPASALSQ